VSTPDSASGGAGAQVIPLPSPSDTSDLSHGSARPTLRSKLTGLQKAAILIVSLGEELGAQILKQMPEEDVRPLTIEISRTRDIAPERVDSVLHEVVEVSSARAAFTEGGLSFARELLGKTYGYARADALLAEMEGALESRPFKFMARAETEQVFSVIRREQPQAIALIMAHLDPAQGAAVLKLFDDEVLQADIIKRIAEMERLSPEVMQEVERTIRDRMYSIAGQDATAVGGIVPAAELINHGDRALEQSVFAQLEQDDPDLVVEIRKLLFVFEDLTMLSQADLQQVVRAVDSKVLALAMRGIPDDLRDLILGAMSERAGVALKEEIETMPRQKRVAVEEAQTKVVEVVRRLEDDGTITINRGEEEADDVV
jgi:flagellar motor switch protein FliG